MRKRRRSYKRIFIIVVSILIGGYLFLFYGFGFIVNMAFMLRDSGKQSVGLKQQKKEVIKIEPALQDVPYATNSATVTVSGNGMPDTTIFMYRNNRQVDQTKSDFDGAFSFSVLLDSGTNTLRVMSKEENGRELNSRTYSVQYKDKPPTLTLSNLEDGKTVSQENFTVEGSVQKEVFVSVNGSPAVVRSDGTFSYVIRLKEGEQTVTVVASDVAGNEVKKDYKLIYKKE